MEIFWESYGDRCKVGLEGGRRCFNFLFMRCFVFLFIDVYFLNMIWCCSLFIVGVINKGGGGERNSYK